jgi:hypothetical protein
LEGDLQAPQYGLDPDRDYHPVRAHPTRVTPVQSIERLLGVAFDSNRPRGLAALLDGDIAGFLDRVPKKEAKAAIGIGPPARLDRIEPSFRRATSPASTSWRT